MRMFAGPNGSGKSVLKSYLPPELLGVYLNPDEIEADIKRNGFLDMRTFEVATDDPEINISRVRNRVGLGGHSVPEDKIASRYDRSLDLLLRAIRYANRAYIFDNSTDNANRRHTWLAEITDGQFMELKTDRIPGWFKRTVLDRIA